jgi:hypothetical protein
MGRMIIGVDPHKASVTIEVVDQHGTLAATGRFPTARGGYQALIRFVRQWPQRVWAVEGTGGAGRPSAPAEASGATTERISARARRLSTLVSTRNVTPRVSSIVEVRAGEHIQCCSNPLLTLASRATQRLVHGVFDRCGSQLESRRLEGVLVNFDQVLGHRPSI